MLDDWRKLLFWGGCAFFVAWFVWWSYASYPLDGSACPSENTNENCPRYNIIFYSAWQVAEFASHWSFPITALATIAIGYFTVTLKRSTDNLWKVTDQTLRHAERWPKSALAKL